MTEKSVEEGIASCLKQVYNLNPDSRVLFTVDGGRKDVCEVFHNAVLNVTQNIAILDLDLYKRPMDAMPACLDNMLDEQKPTIAINLFESIPTERPVRVAYLEKLVGRKVAVAHCPGIDSSMLRQYGPFDNDFEKLATRGQELISIFQQYKEYEIWTGIDDRMRLSVGDRKWKSDLSRIEAGMGNLPPGEICIGPVENSANGTILVKGRAGEHILENYAVLRWENGELVDVAYPVDEMKPELLGDTKKKFSRIIGELGIGFNPNADPNSKILESEKSGVHIARGPQKDMGSELQAEDHMDFLVENARIYGIDESGMKFLIYP